MILRSILPGLGLVIAVVVSAVVAYAVVEDAPFGLRSPQLEADAIEVHLPPVGEAERSHDRRSAPRPAESTEVALAPSATPAAGVPAAVPVRPAPREPSRGRSVPVDRGGGGTRSPAPLPLAPSPPPAAPARTPEPTPAPTPAAPVATPEPVAPQPTAPRRQPPPTRAAVPEPEEDQELIEEVVRDLLPPAEPAEPPESEEPELPGLPFLPGSPEEESEDHGAPGSGPEDCPPHASEAPADQD